MEKYEYTDKCREISGFGGKYEEWCRKMVVAGIKWLDRNKNANPTFSQSPQIIGMTFDENKDMQMLQTVMSRSVDDCTGAMMQASTNHVLFAHKNGWEKYIEEMEKQDEEE